MPLLKWQSKINSLTCLFSDPTGTSNGSGCFFSKRLSEKTCGLNHPYPRNFHQTETEVEDEDEQEE
jgi:hypothetical protein